MCLSPFDLIQTDLYVKWIGLLFMFIPDEFLIDQISVFQFMAMLHLQQSGGLEQMLPPAGRVLFQKIIFKDIYNSFGGGNLKV